MMYKRSISRPSKKSALVVFMLSCTGIANAQQTQERSNMENPPRSSVTRDALSEFDQHWPKGRSALFKLSDRLILAIPPQYQQFWRQGDGIVRAPARAADVPKVSIVAFSFFIPEFTGYTRDNFQEQYDSKRVDITTLEPADPRQADPNAPGYFPPNMFKRLIEAGMDAKTYQQLYGLRCYRFDAGPPGRSTCFGKRDAETDEDIMLDVYLPPYTPNIVFPIMQAMYFTRRYGGLRIVWKAHAATFASWHEIDQQIWKFIDSWNIAKSAGTRTRP